MNIAVTSQEMKKAEGYMIDRLGLPSLVLMEKAAEKVFEAVQSLPDKTPHPVVSVLCGCGNNGGDGLAVARIMHQKGIDVSVCIIGDESRATDEFKLQKSIFEKLGGKIDINPLYRCDLIIDAMLGIGIKGEVRSPYRETIIELNSYHNLSENNAQVPAVISVDIPSGLDADKGFAAGCAVNADVTVCLGCIKTGLLLNEGPLYAGKVLRDDIGINPPSDFSALVPETDDIKLIFPKRTILSNKSTYGKVAIIAGSEGMPGAAVLATKASMTSGVGMSRLLTDPSILPTIVSTMPEVMTDSYSCITPGTDDKSTLNTRSIDSAIDWCDALLIGPGLGRSSQAEELFLYVMEKCNKPMVIDADGLFHLSVHMDLLKNRQKNTTIVTPHPGEFCRLFGTVPGDKKHQDIEFVKALSAKNNITILAKDCSSIITDGENVYINTFGTDALATAGTGDVLAGIVLTMLVNCIKNNGSETSCSLVNACITGAALHGLSGIKASAKTNEYAVTASDVASCIPEAVDYFTT